MVLDHQCCSVEGCTVHVGMVKTTPNVKRNKQIRDDWASGLWTVEELSYFWGLRPREVSRIVATPNR